MALTQSREPEETWLSSSAGPKKVIMLSDVVVSSATAATSKGRLESARAKTVDGDIMMVVFVKCKEIGANNGNSLEDVMEVEDDVLK